MNKMAKLSIFRMLYFNILYLTFSLTVVNTCHIQCNCKMSMLENDAAAFQLEL